VAGTALGFGYLLDYLFHVTRVQAAHACGWMMPEAAGTALAIALLVLLGYALIPRGAATGLVRNERCYWCAGAGKMESFTRNRGQQAGAAML